MKIDDELKSTFPSVAVKVHVNILYTAHMLQYKDYLTLKPFGISIQQYNILRILKGRKGKPASLKILTERMIDKVSNTSRLVDKLVLKGLVDRLQCKDNRRQVDVTITKLGLKTLEKATQAMEECQNDCLMPEEDLEHLSELLDKFRG